MFTENKKAPNRGLFIQNVGIEPSNRPQKSGHFYQKTSSDTVKIQTKTNMKNIYQKIIGSFDTITKNAFSARKLTALAIMICILVAHGAWLKRAFISEDFSLLEGVLMIDYGVVLSLLGLTTYENIKTSKTKPNETTPPAAPADSPTV